mmetsp:Transcript_79922/g.156296  ORF Transcript_79922/g.156296 Transcript_79922/m.156296 type:complete len:867 (+) Transcript_79922:146-2746(+)
MNFRSVKSPSLAFYFGILTSFLVTTSSYGDDTIFFGFTEEEALSFREDGIKLASPRPVQQEFAAWLKRTSQTESGLGKESVKPEIFKVGQAQTLAKAFCRSEREGRTPGKRCLWSEYQACVSFVLRPFSKTFAHDHLEGVFTEATVRGKLPAVKPCTSFEGVPTAIQFANVVAASVPVVFKGAVRHWPAVERWTFDYLNKALPAMTWPVFVAPDGDFDCVENVDRWRKSPGPKKNLQANMHRNQVEEAVDLSGDTNMNTGNDVSGGGVNGRSNSFSDTVSSPLKQLKTTKILTFDDYDNVNDYEDDSDGVANEVEEVDDEKTAASARAVEFILARPASIRLNTSLLLRAIEVTGWGLSENDSSVAVQIERDAGKQKESAATTPVAGEGVSNATSAMNGSVASVNGSSGHLREGNTSASNRRRVRSGYGSGGGARGPKAYIEYFPLAQLRHDAYHATTPGGGEVGMEALRRVDKMLSQDFGPCSSIANALSPHPPHPSTPPPLPSDEQQQQQLSAIDGSKGEKEKENEVDINITIPKKCRVGEDVLSFSDFLVPTHRLLWFGSGGTLGNLHFDRQENIMAVLRGAKTFTLYDPTQSKNLYHGTPLLHSSFEADLVTEKRRSKVTFSLQNKSALSSSSSKNKFIEEHPASIHFNRINRSSIYNTGGYGDDNHAPGNGGETQDLVIRIGRPKDSLTKARSDFREESGLERAGENRSVFSGSVKWGASTVDEGGDGGGMSDSSGGDGSGDGILAGAATGRVDGEASQSGYLVQRRKQKDGTSRRGSQSANTDGNVDGNNTSNKSRDNNGEYISVYSPVNASDPDVLKRFPKFAKTNLGNVVPKQETCSSFLRDGGTRCCLRVTTKGRPRP